MRWEVKRERALNRDKNPYGAGRGSGSFLTLLNIWSFVAFGRRLPTDCCRSHTYSLLSILGMNI